MIFFIDSVHDKCRNPKNKWKQEKDEKFHMTSLFLRGGDVGFSDDEQMNNNLQLGLSSSFIIFPFYDGCI